MSERLQQNSPKVFISYSRRDAEFAENLLDGLEAAGFDAYLDKHDIAAGEDWEARLGNLIESADTVVFVISSAAVASQQCAWEVEKARALNKRILPVVLERVEDAQVPEQLRQLNYLFFDRPQAFGTCLKALATALNSDVEWIRMHTRLGSEALRWDARNRPEALLLRGEELAESRAWLAKPPRFAPEPTLLHHQFIKASEDEQSNRANEERQKLEQIALAQVEREKALRREEVALRRGQRTLRAAGALLGLFFLAVLAAANRDRLTGEYYRLKYWARHYKTVFASDTNRKFTAGTIFQDCTSGSNDCPKMVVIPPGTFRMGSPVGVGEKDEYPERMVKISEPFAVSKFEITFAEWDACVAHGGCIAVDDAGWGRGTRPVMRVSWNDAQQYVRWLSKVTGRTYRLLTEAEWEYAARAGTKTHYPWGNLIGRGNGNCRSCGSQWDGKQTAPVGSFKANAFGLFDMNGNVAEWVHDPWHANYKGAPQDGSAWLAGGDRGRRILRGGTWAGAPLYVRSADRHAEPHAYRDFTVGLRVARTINR
ncbi:MAG: SUMF1/EgtB/PvdO family nonheme iron enzyme [Hyphomicrobiaceae bacterium]|nr:SUMF1/EgtB/PvdO family nonheme iron enzyme [Hyphomicrobiaceae bacterium]